MCLQCGCGMPYNDLGEPDKNITVDDIKKSVGSRSARGITTDKAIENIINTWKKVTEEDKGYVAD